MKVVLTILFSCLAMIAVSQPTEAVLLKTAVKEFHQALVNKDTDAIKRQTDKALSYGHSNGWIQTKSNIIKDFERDYISYQSFKEDSITISMNGNLANVRFIADISAKLNNTIVNNYHLRVLEVWVKKGKDWILFARQAVKS